MAFLVIAAGVAYGAVLFVHSLSHESTDNAYVTGMIVPVAPEVRGRVVNVYVTDNQYVEAGSRLVEISPDDYSDQVKERSQAVSTLTAEERNLKRSSQRERRASPRHRPISVPSLPRRPCEKTNGALHPPRQRGSRIGKPV